MPSSNFDALADRALVQAVLGRVEVEHRRHHRRAVGVVGQLADSSSSQGFCFSSGVSAALAAQANPPRSTSAVGHAQHARLRRLIQIQATGVVARLARARPRVVHLPSNRVGVGGEAQLGARRPPRSDPDRSADRSGRPGRTRRCRWRGPRPSRPDRVETRSSATIKKLAAAIRPIDERAAARIARAVAHRQPRDRQAAGGGQRWRSIRCPAGSKSTSTPPPAPARREPTNAPACASPSSRVADQPTATATTKHHRRRDGGRVARDCAGRRLLASLARPAIAAARRGPIAAASRESSAAKRSVRWQSRSPDFVGVTYSSRNGVLIAPSHQVLRPTSISQA